jgi:radical SAM family uncharacterized protein/radical SAM-linked protein
MDNPTIQDILPLVEKPSRYLGCEINTVKKDLSKVKLKVALVFPDLYEIGTSHFGIQILYSILNSHPDIAAERVYLPAKDLQKELRENKLPLLTLESGEPLNTFDIIGFSLLYELNFTNVLAVLDLADIPFYSRDRSAQHPLIIAGGPCTCNPEPMADFFDAMVIGDGEEVILQLCKTRMDRKPADPASRKVLLKGWQQIDGVYIPEFFEPLSDEFGRQTVSPRYPKYGSVNRAILGDLDSAFFPQSPIVPFGRPIHDRLRLEVSRGCTRGCRFCQAGMLYRPVRERSVATLLSICEQSIATTGYEDLSLLSLSTSDYGCIGPLIKALMDRYAAKRHAVSFPSLRAGTLTPELMELIKKVRKTGFTIAPEAGSKRLRDVINKNITRDDIVETVREVSQQGWQVIKLYFMIGLPTEGPEDLEAIVDLVQELRQIRDAKGFRIKINVSVTTFIPKSHTPFQWEGQLSLQDSKAKIDWLRKKLKGPGLQFKWQNSETSLLEGLMARGDRRFSRLIETAYGLGCQLDGWSDHFDFDKWNRAILESGIDVDDYTTRRRNPDEPLPWDHIDIGVSRDFLKSEYQKAGAGQTIGDCREGECNLCGVCDFDGIQPRVYDHCSVDPWEEKIPRTKVAGKKIEVTYTKLGQVKYLGHLELMNVFLRALRRADVPLIFSAGFHPKPKVSFLDSLPVGLESHAETLFVSTSGSMEAGEICTRLNQQLPPGIEVTGCREVVGKPKTSRMERIEYQVILKSKRFDEQKLSLFEQAREWVFERQSKKGRIKKIDLKKMVAEIELTSPLKMKIILQKYDGLSVRPAEILARIFELSRENILSARILKL